MKSINIKAIIEYFVLWNISLFAVACGEDEPDWGKETTIHWLKETNGQACYYRKYKQSEMEPGQKLTEGYVWLFPSIDKTATFIKLTLRHTDKKGWWFDTGMMVKTKTGYKTGWFDGCDPTTIHIRAKNDGLQSIYVEDYGYGEMPEGLILRFDRVPDARCKNMQEKGHWLYDTDEENW